MDRNPISWISFHRCQRMVVLEGGEVVMNGGAGTLVRSWWKASRRVGLSAVKEKGRGRKDNQKKRNGRKKRKHMDNILIWQKKMT